MKIVSKVLASAMILSLVFPASVSAQNRGDGVTFASESRMFSPNTKDDWDVDFLNSCTTKCGVQTLSFAAKFCAKAATRFQKQQTNWYNSNVPFIIVAALGTALGASSLASAKAWGVLGGTTGISASWKSEADQITGVEQQKLNSINGILGKLAQDVAGKDEQTVIQLALTAAAQCAAPSVEQDAPKDPPKKTGDIEPVAPKKTADAAPASATPSPP